jgi:hypothetical protein
VSGCRGTSRGLRLSMTTRSAAGSEPIVGIADSVNTSKRGGAERASGVPHGAVMHAQHAEGLSESVPSDLRPGAWQGGAFLAAAALRFAQSQTASRP